MARKKVIIRCGCKTCTAGMHRGAMGGFQMQQTIKRVRRTTKALLKQGEYDGALDVIESAGYLD